MEMSEEYEAEEYLHCGAKFDRRRMEMFSIRDERSFFTPIQRIRLVDSVVKQVSIGRTKRPKNSRKEENHSVPVNLHYLMNNKKAYSAAFPLHDSQFQYREEWRNPFRDVPAKCHPYRKWLFETWGSFKQFHKYQPIPQIRAYFGEEIGYYFALLGLYSKMLLYPAVLSFIFLLGSLAQVATDPVINDICHSPVYADKVFCPLCHGRIVQCPTTPVPAACLSMKISRTFDNDLTVAFAVFISIWAVFFQEFWKRRQNELAAIWDATEEESGDSALRPDFIQKVILHS